MIAKNNNKNTTPATYSIHYFVIERMCLHLRCMESDGTLQLQRV